MMIKIVMFLLVLLALLTWIGWRFFIQPVRAENLAMMGAPVPSVGMLAAQAGLGEAMERAPEKKRDGLSNWRWFKCFAHWSVWLMPLLAGLTVMSVLALSERISLDPLQALDFKRQEHIQSVLNPEVLAPPPSFPPSLFILSERPGLETADRDWGRLDPHFVQVVLQVFARTQARGYPFALLEGYRSPERQDTLAQSGAHITNARAFQSKHQYGLALDAGPLKEGKLVISERDPWAWQAYQVLGEEAEKAGLVWGGRWTLKDFGHIEVAGPITASLTKK